MKSIMYFLFYLLIIFYSCNVKKDVMIQVAMSKEHDAGFFKPENGDRISIAGEFNNWKPDSIFLEDENGDWIFTKSLPTEIISKDTLVFKFKCSSGDNRLIANSGWEGIPYRSVSLSEIIKEQPVFIFNEIYDHKESVELTFTVGTSNQQILGFFCPEEGDRMVVSGSFCNWNEEGILMLDEHKDKIYSITVPVRIVCNKSIQYKYKILTNRNVLLPNQGWEELQHREFLPDKYNFIAPYAEFSNIQRVGRFIINMKKLINSDQFNSMKGDILQLKLFLDDKESFSNPFTQISSDIWEISLTFPLTVKTIKWQLLKNQKNELSKIFNIEVSFSGSIIKYEGCQINSKI